MQQAKQTRNAANDGLFPVTSMSPMSCMSRHPPCPESDVCLKTAPRSITFRDVRSRNSNHTPIGKLHTHQHNSDEVTLRRSSINISTGGAFLSHVVEDGE